MVIKREKSDIIHYDGYDYLRWPDSPNWADRVYYNPEGKALRAGKERLHRQLWKDANGSIPEGYEIHHKDGNPLNNTLSNLECLSPKDHTQWHAENISEERREQARERIDSIRHLASAWHQSPEGRAWHSALAKQMWADREPHEQQCLRCGKSYLTRHEGDSKFCSNACKSAWRRASGVDNEIRQCLHCGKSFEANRYSKIKTCSRSCNARFSAARKKAGL